MYNWSTEPLNATPRKKMFIVHMDDVLTVLRQLRREGFVFRRGRDLTGAKTLSFEIYGATDPISPLHIIIVDVFRHGERGQIIAMNEPQWELKFPEYRIGDSIRWPGFRYGYADDKATPPTES